MKKANFYFLIFVFMLCLLNLMGCASTNKDSDISTSALLEPQAVLKFNDIPVPVGLKLIPQDSYSYESGTVRIALLKYQGKVNTDQVVNFYKEQMPMFKWNLLNSIEYGQRLLNFEREEETCIINLLPKGATTIVTISLGPKSQIPKKEEAPVK